MSTFSKTFAALAGGLALLVCCPAAMMAAGASGTWTSAGSTIYWGLNPTATVLANGKVLVAGGQGTCNSAYCGGLSTAQIYDPASNSWITTGSMNFGRWAPTATRLPNGKVLVAGGCCGPDGISFLASAELYDPISGTWSITGSMHVARFTYAAVLLHSGKVLVSGGSSALPGGASAELYDPKTGQWTLTGVMSTARFEHTMTLLGNGHALVAGGANSSFQGLTSAELYDPSTGKWQPTGSMTVGRQAHTATLLANGKVLVAGGYTTAPSLASTEVYDPGTGAWSASGSMATARWGHTATRLQDGSVLVAGGEGPCSQQCNLLAYAELYDPAIGQWFPTGSMAAARVSAVAARLATGQALVVGGETQTTLTYAELYNP